MSNLAAHTNLKTKVCTALGAQRGYRSDEQPGWTRYEWVTGPEHVAEAAEKLAQSVQEGGMESLLSPVQKMLNADLLYVVNRKNLSSAQAVSDVSLLTALAFQPFQR